MSIFQYSNGEMNLRLSFIPSPVPWNRIKFHLRRIEIILNSFPSNPFDAKRVKNIVPDKGLLKTKR